MNVATRYEENEQNKVEILYWNEFDNEELIARCYRVDIVRDGKLTRHNFADGTTWQNKKAAYDLYWQTEEELLNS